MIDTIDSVLIARADLLASNHSRFDEEVMNDIDRALAAEDAYIAAQSVLAQALKDQFDFQKQASAFLRHKIRKIHEAQESLNHLGSSVRKKAAFFMGAREITLKSTFNLKSAAQSDKIAGSVKSTLSVFSHGRFLSHDLAHRMSLNGTCLVKATEPYSTALCATCGQCVRGQGRSKIYHCSNPACRSKHDRDEGGAKGNAMIKLAGFFAQADEEDAEELDDGVVDAAPDDDFDAVRSQSFLLAIGGGVC